MGTKIAELKPTETARGAEDCIPALEAANKALEEANRVLSDQVKELSIKVQVLQDAYSDSEQMCMSMRVIATQRGMEIKHLNDALAKRPAE